MNVVEQQGSGRVLAPPPRGPIEPLAAAPTFSILIPAYQAAETIGDAVRSAVDQVHKPHEVIVVNDGSTDDLESALREFEGRIKVLHREHSGVGSARNAGVSAATGEFVALLDADDAYHPRRLEALAELAMARPDLDLITTDARFVTEGHVTGTFLAANPFEVSEQRAAILRSCFVGGWPAVRLSRLRAVGGFDEDLRVANDWDCWLRLILDGAAAGLVERPYYDYRLKSPGSLTADKASSRWARVRMLEKARRNPSLGSAERGVLARSLREHRTRAVLTEAREAANRSGPRRRLPRLALSRGIGIRTRAIAMLAAVAPPLARRLLPRG